MQGEDIRSINTDLVLDASDFSSPASFLKTRKVLKNMSEGQTLKIICSHPGSMAMISLLTAKESIRLLGMLETDHGEICYYIVKDNHI